MGVRGDREVVERLRAMANAITPAVRKKARQKALKPIERDATARLVSNGNVETRALASAMTTTEDPRKQNTSIVAVKRGKRGRKNRNPVRYAHLVEYGTAPHWQPNRFGGIMHPGARPFPYMRPSFEANREDAPRIYFQEVWTAIARLAK
jgi:hypothetical protein